jgi:hypothetical protein
MEQNAALAHGGSAKFQRPFAATLAPFAAGLDLLQRMVGSQGGARTGQGRCGTVAEHNLLARHVPTKRMQHDGEQNVAGLDLKESRTRHREKRLETGEGPGLKLRQQVELKDRGLLCPGPGDCHRRKTRGAARHNDQEAQRPTRASMD